MIMSDTFRRHEFNSEMTIQSDVILNIAEDLEAEIALFVVPSREKSLAMTKLEECVMWANKAIAIHGIWDGGSDE